MDEPQPQPQISVSEPVTQAIECARIICFDPFDFKKWFVIGFCAFLALLLQDGGLNIQIPDFSGPGRGPNPLQGALDWIKANVGLTVLIALAWFAFVFALWQLCVWLSCRGLFMFMHCIIFNRAEVVEPWHRYASLGNQLFKLAAIANAAWMGLSILSMAAGLGLAWNDIVAGRFSAVSITALVLFVLVAVGMWIFFEIFHAILRDFVAPAMYLRNIGPVEAWRVVRAEIFDGRLGTIAIFYLLRIATHFVHSTAAVLVCCVTLCLAGLPYLGRVATLPVLVFHRAYPLYFLEQFGPQWKFFPEAPPPVVDQPMPRFAPEVPQGPPPLPPEPPKVLPLE